MASGADASAGSGAGRVDGGGGAEAGVIVGGGGGGGAGSPTIGTPFVKPLVAVDLDEVLGAFVEALAQWHNTVFGTKLTTADFRSYHFSDVWGGTTEEAVAKVRDFYASNEFTGLSPLAAAFETLRQHSTFLRFAVVTSRQHVVADKTRAWLDRHFPGIFETIVFANHYGDAGSGTTRCVRVAQCTSLMRTRSCMRAGANLRPPSTSRSHTLAAPSPTSAVSWAP